MTAKNQSTAHLTAATRRNGDRRPDRPAGSPPDRAGRAQSALSSLEQLARPTVGTTAQRPVGQPVRRLSAYGLRGRRTPRRRDHVSAGTGRRGHERGMVTAEIAVALPVLVALTLGLVCVVAAVGAQLRCADLARESARALARGESAASVRARVLGDAPPRAALGVRRSGGMVTATVTATAPVIGTDLLRVPGVRVHATATAADEKSLAEQPW